MSLHHDALYTLPDKVLLAMPASDGSLSYLVLFMGTPTFFFPSPFVFVALLFSPPPIDSRK